MRQVRLLSAAEEEMNASARYYEGQLTGLGQRFLIEIGRTIDAIRALPDSGTPFVAGTRRKLLGHFPFALLYHITPAAIIVVAVMHQQRKPGHWKQRAE